MVKGKILCNKCLEEEYGSVVAAMKAGKKVRIFLDYPRWRCSKCGRVVEYGYFVYGEVEE